MATLSFLQYGGRPPSWICCARVRTTQQEYLVVSIVVQNLVGIGVVVSTIWRILDLRSDPLNTVSTGGDLEAQRRRKQAAVQLQPGGTDEEELYCSVRSCRAYAKFRT